MQHYEVQSKSLSDLVTAYPHSPEDEIQSQMDYLEDMLSQGYELVTRDGSTGGWYYMFKVVAK